MKRIVTLTILFCSIASSVLAANPEDALKALNLGNQKYVLEQSMEGGPLAAVIVDPTVSASPAALFGLAGTQLIAAKTDGTGLEQALGAPLILILGTEENAVWAVYAEVLKSSADLIHAVLKGKTVIQGAVLTPSTGEVKILGSHPDLVIMAAQHVLGTPAQPAPADATPAPPAMENPAAGESPAAQTQADPAPEAAQGESHATPVQADQNAATAEKHEAPASGRGPVGVIIFILALIAAVVFMDKTVLKP